MSTSNATTNRLALLMETSPNIIDFFKCEMPKNGFNILSACTKDDLLRQAEKTPPDIIILGSLRFQEVSQEQILVDLRKRIQIPIVVLLNSGHSKTQAHFINLGADDCQALPIRTSVLTAHLHAVLRRGEIANFSSTFKVGHLEVDPERRMVKSNGVILPSLGKSMTNLLFYLVKNEGGHAHKTNLLT